MITLNLFTSGQHTASLVKTLKKAPQIKLLDIFAKIQKTSPADVYLVAEFGQIIPPSILKIPRFGCLGIHPSLLPYYRGPTPVQAALLAGDRKTGITIIKMDEKIDHGPIIAQFKEKINQNDTAESLYQGLFSASGEVLVTILPAWVEGRITPRPQNHRLATYTSKLTRDDGQINWSQTDPQIERFIRAMTSWPGAFTNLKLKMKNKKSTKRLKILKAHLENKKLILDQVQLEGKKPVSWKQFQEGYPQAQIVKS